MEHQIYTPDTATPPADESLKALIRQIGFAPNVFAVMGGEPEVLDAFITLNGKFAETSFSPVEREIIQMAVSVQNNCTYCVAGHTAFMKMIKAPEGVATALRSGTNLEDTRLESLRRFAEFVARAKGHVTDEDRGDFLRAGYTAAQAQEVVLGICVKMFSNLISNLLNVELDAVFEPMSWTRDELVSHRRAA